MRFGVSSLQGAAMLLGVLAAACASPKGATVEEKSAHVLRVRDETLRDLYRQEPEARARLQGAPGYAVFSNLGSQLFVLSTGRGYGVAVDNRTGRETFMRMSSVGVGLGMGVKDFRTIFIFHDPGTFRNFVNEGWEFGGDADVAAVTDDKGGQVSGAGVASSSIEVYQFTEAGLALKAAIAGTRYTKDDELN